MDMDWDGVVSIYRERNKEYYDTKMVRIMVEMIGG